MNWFLPVGDGPAKAALVFRRRGGRRFFHVAGHGLSHVPDFAPIPSDCRAKARRNICLALAAGSLPPATGARRLRRFTEANERGSNFSTASTLQTLKRAEARASAALVHGARIVPIRSMSPNQSASKSSQPSLVIPPAASWDNSRSAEEMFYASFP